MDAAEQTHRHTLQQYSINSSSSSSQLSLFLIALLHSPQPIGPFSSTISSSSNHNVYTTTTTTSTTPSPAFKWIHRAHSLSLLFLSLFTFWSHNSGNLSLHPLIIVFGSCCRHLTPHTFLITFSLQFPTRQLLCKRRMWSEEGTKHSHQTKPN